jgi:hypothetical protein
LRVLAVEQVRYRNTTPTEARTLLLLCKFDAQYRSQSACPRMANLWVTEISNPPPNAVPKPRDHA